MCGGEGGITLEARFLTSVGVCVIRDFFAGHIAGTVWVYDLSM